MRERRGRSLMSVISSADTSSASASWGGEKKGKKGRNYLLKLIQNFGHPHIKFDPWFDPLCVPGGVCESHPSSSVRSHPKMVAHGLGVKPYR
ncbi:hypothetical protein TNCV_774431 [Trichonephila clavipes]|nr:hypothetical protein TNCV_774431 [Trichonephila clavipes]